MADKKISLKIAIDGEAAYRDSIKKINSENKTLNAEMKQLQAVYADSANSYDYLAKKGEILAKVQGELEKKTDDYRNLLTLTKMSLLEHRSATEELAEAAEKATSAYKEAKKETDTYKKALDAAEDALASYKKQLIDSGESLSAHKDKITALKKAQLDAKEAYNISKKSTAELKKEMDSANASYARNASNIKYCEEHQELYGRQIIESETELIKLNREIDKNNTYLQEAATSFDGTAHSIDKYGNEVKSVSEETKSFTEIAGDLAKEIIASGGLAMAVNELKDLLIDCAKSAIEFESAFAGVEKTVDGTEDELKDISDGIKELATEIPLTTSELAKIAETAGQLGIAKENILGFTEVVANLSATTDLSAEEAAVSLARIANITKLMTSEYDNFGSTLVALGNNSAAFESEILAMTTRLASTGDIVGATNAQLLGIATTLVSVGIEAEAGGTAFSKLLKDIETAIATGSDKVAQYAKVAGMSASDFATAWEKDAVGAVAKFIEGLGNLESQGGSAIVTLKDLELSDQRLQNVILALNGAQGLLTNNLELANSAWADNNALTEEAEKRYSTTESKITLAKTAIDNLKITIGDELLEQFDGFIGKFTDLVTECDKFLQKNPDVITGINTLKKALGINDELNEVKDSAGNLVEELQELKKEYTETADAASKMDILSETKSMYEKLTSSIADYDKKLAESRENLADLQEEQKKLLETQSKSYEEEQANSIKAASLATQIDAERKNIQTYINARNALGEQRRKTVEDIALWGVELGNTTEAIEELGDTVTDTGGKTAETVDAFDEFFTSIENSGKKSASALADYGEAFKAGFSVPFLTAINETASNSDEVLGAMMTRYRELVTTYGEGSEEVKAFVTGVNTTFAESAGAEDALVEGLKEYGIVVEETGKKAVTSTKATKEAIDEAGKAIITHADTVKKNLETLTKEYDSAYKSAQSSLGGIGGLFGEVAFKTDKSISDMLSGLDSQVDYFTGYMLNLQRASQIGIDEGLVAALADGSDESAGYLQKIIDEFNKVVLEFGEGSPEVEAFVTDFNTKFEATSKAKDALAATMAGIQTNFEERAGDILAQADDLITELSDYSGNAYDEVSKAVSETLTDIADGFTKFQVMAQEKSQGIIDAANYIKTGINTTLEVLPEEMKVAGQNVSLGLSEGILDKAGVLEDTVRRLAKEAIIGAAKDELGIRSPAEEGREIGKFYDEGIAQGIERNESTVISANLKMISDLEARSQSAAAAAGASLGKTMAQSMAAALQAGQALRQAAESGNLTVNGNKVQTAAQAGIPSLSGQAATDWNAEMKAMWGLPDNWTNQDITDWHNSGGFLNGNGGSSVSLEKAVEQAVKNENSMAQSLIHTTNKAWHNSYLNQLAANKSKSSGSSGGTTVVVNQTFAGTTSPHQVKKAAEEGVKNAVYY